MTEKDNSSCDVKFDPKFTRHKQKQLTIGLEPISVRHRPLPSKLLNPLQANSIDSCFNCVRAESYSTCEFACRYCSARGYVETLYAAFYDYKNPSELDVPRPAKLEQIAKMLKIAYRRNSNSNTTISALRKGVPIHLSVLSDPFQNTEKSKFITIKSLRIIKEYDHPVILASKSDLQRKNPWFKEICNSSVKVVQTSLSVLDRVRASKVEPNAPDPRNRLDMVADFQKVGIRGVVRISPLIPKFTEWEKIMEEAAKRNIGRIMFASFYARPEFVRGMAPIVGYDIFKYYTERPHVSIVGGALHLSYQEIGKLCMKMRDKADELGIKINFTIPCWFYLESDDYNCCGMDGLIPKENMSRLNYHDAALEIMHRKKLHWSEYLKLRENDILSKEHLHTAQMMWKESLQQICHMEVIGKDEKGYPIYHFIKDDPRTVGIDLKIKKS